MAAVGINLSSSLLSAASQAGGPSAINQLLRSAQSKSTSQASDPDGDGDTHGISKAGQFLSKLQSLKQSDPTKFKELLTQISDQLSAAALQAGAGTQQNQFLSDLAAKFKDVANGGDISQLQPPRAASNR